MNRDASPHSHTTWVAADRTSGWHSQEDFAALSWALQQSTADLLCDAMTPAGHGVWAEAYSSANGQPLVQQHSHEQVCMAAAAALSVLGRRAPADLPTGPILSKEGVYAVMIVELIVMFGASVVCVFGGVRTLRTVRKEATAVSSTILRQPSTDSVLDSSEPLLPGGLSTQPQAVPGSGPPPSAKQQSGGWTSWFT